MQTLKFLWYYLREKFPVNRVVSILTPFLVLAAGSVSVWVAENVPWLSDVGFNKEELTAIFIGVAAATLAALYQWINGKLKWDLQTRQLVHANDPLDLPTVPADAALPVTTTEQDIALAVADTPKPPAKKAPAKKPVKAPAKPRITRAKK